MIDVPEPDDSGSTGTQTKANDSAISLVPERAVVGRPLEQTIVGLAATNSRNMGGEVAATLLAGSFSHISHELSEARAEAKGLRKELDAANSCLQAEKVSNATLRGTLGSAENEKAIRSVCLVAGTAIASFGADQIKSNQVAAGITFAVIGVILSLVGWFSVGGRASK